MGRAQAKEAAARLQASGADLASLSFVASPLGRTRETMELLRVALGLAPHDYRVEPQLTELTFGAWEGLTWREVRRRDPSGAASRARDKWGFAPPGGGESYAMLRERVEPVLSRLPRPVLVVGHGGVARVMLHLLAGVPAEKAPQVDIWQGRVLVFEGGGSRWA